MDDLYKRLGISETASKEEIKKAYKKKAMKNHPDKGGDPKDFHKINYAYMVLTNETQRSKYDKGENFESDNKQSPEQRFRETLSFVVMDIVPKLERDKVIYSDVLKIVSGIVEQQLSGLAEESRKKRREIGKFIQVRKRLSGEDSEWFKESLWSQVEDLKNQKSQMQDQYDTGKMMVEKLSKWEYKVDEKPKPKGATVKWSFGNGPMMDELMRFQARTRTDR